MHVTLGGPEGMLLTKSNSTKRARPPTFKEGVNAPRAHGCHVIHVYHAFKVWVPYLRACGYPSMTPVVGTEACLCPRYQQQKNRPMVKKKSSINQLRSIRQKSKNQKEKGQEEKKENKLKNKTRGLSAPKKKRKIRSQ